MISPTTLTSASLSIVSQFESSVTAAHEGANVVCTDLVTPTIATLALVDICAKTVLNITWVQEV